MKIDRKRLAELLEVENNSAESVDKICDIIEKYPGLRVSEPDDIINIGGLDEIKEIFLNHEQEYVKITYELGQNIILDWTSGSIIFKEGNIEKNINNQLNKISNN